MPTQVPFFILPLKIPTGNLSWGCGSKMWGKEKGEDVESRARSYLCPFFAHPQREKGKTPAQLNKQLDWGRVEPEWAKILSKQENGVAKERGCHIQPGSCAADCLQSSRRARSNIPSSKVQRTPPRLRAPRTRDADKAKAGLFFISVIIYYQR